jgi:1-acyl-sn-glycerol-3-phosphate acyltransferase
MKSFDPDRLDGRDPQLIARLLPTVRRLNRHYLRLTVEGLEHVGGDPMLYVGNHNGGIAGPDLACTIGTLWDARSPEAGLYALAHDFAMTQLTPLGALLQKVGALRAHPENARRALAAGAAVLVYPGGDLDAYRHSSRRDEVVLGERTGFVRVAQEMGVPIVPIVASGAHRSAYIFSEGKRIARWSGLERWGRLKRFPLALALPWGFAPSPWLPYLPLPFPIRLKVLAPIAVPATSDPREVREHVQRTMQSALTECKSARRESSRRSARVRGADHEGVRM